MDGSRFDQLARSLGALRSRRAVNALLSGAVVAPLLAGSDIAAKGKGKKKKKKTCAKKCPNGCCTGKYGTCIQPAQQSLGLCGTGGETCRSTGCGGTCPNCGCSASKPCPAGQCCDGQGTCGACRVFLSSAKPNGNLGGLAGADAICQNLATTAGLPGTYMAWLSDTTGSPSTRFTQASVPYTLVNGTTVAANWSALTSGTIAHAIDLTETGAAGGGFQAWTNTLSNGTPGGIAISGHCNNWSFADNSPGNLGLSSVTSDSWTRFTSHDCSDSGIRGLYCFQQR